MQSCSAIFSGMAFVVDNGRHPLQWYPDLPDSLIFSRIQFALSVSSIICCCTHSSPIERTPEIDSTNNRTIPFSTIQFRGSIHSSWRQVSWIHSTPSSIPLKRSKATTHQIDDTQIFFTPAMKT
jgi:hypothetical protein